jgi:hypothetical protein
LAEGFFISSKPEELRKAVLIMASNAKGGIHEWLEMECDEFLLWLNSMKELNHV